MKAVQVICGSVRPTRIGHDIARWVMEALPNESGIAAELVDLTKWPLPMDDEPGVPARDSYIHPHTRNWSRKIAEAHAFVFVTPQYNWGYPAALKNALDHLFHEWAKKPAIIVTYGFHGGGKCAAQLREVLEGLRMIPVQTMPALVLPPEMKKGEPVDLEVATLAPASGTMTEAWLELASLLSSPEERTIAR
jgi:NAD(P)H-dependent FMN reductase